jgi:diguanylate cyclase (GGDEF)-like protein
VRSPRPILDLPQRAQAAQILLGLAAVLAVTALARPLAPDRPVWLRASVLLLLAVGVALSAILTSLRGRGRVESLALYVFLTLAVDALAQWAAPQGWPVWPAMVLLLAAVSIAEPMTMALGIAALAATLETAAVARGGFVDWKPALMAILGYGGLVFAVNRALAVEKERLGSTLAELARLRHGIGHLEETMGGAAVPLAPLDRKVSEEERRTRQMERVADLDASLERLVRLARQALGAHAMLLFTVDRDHEHACLRAADGDLTLKRGALVPVRQDPFAFVVDRGQTFYVTDFKRLLWALPYRDGEVKVGSLLAAPVVEGGSVRSVLVAEHMDVQALSDHHEMLEAFAAMVSEAFVRARDAARREERGTELDVAHHVSTELAALKTARSVSERLLAFANVWMPLEGAAIVRVDEHRTRYVVEAAVGWAEPYRQREVGLDEKTWASWSVKSGQAASLGEVGSEGHDTPVLVLDEDSRAGDSLLVLPLNAQSRSLGAVVLTAGKGVFKASATSVIEILVNQAAAILANIEFGEREKRRAMTDPLTDLYNRRAFAEILSQAIARSERRTTPLCLLMLDLDHFKKLNDTYGHPAGDAALRETAAVLKRVLRKGDVPARHGGEEFVVMLPDATEVVAHQIAERLRSTLEKTAVSFGGTTLRVTASVGLAVWPEHGHEAGELVAAADRALYVAKAEGRNRVICAPRPVAPAAEVARELNGPG